MKTERESGDIAPSRENGVAPSHWRLIRRALVALVGAGLGVLGGCISGAEYGGNYTTGFSFLRMPGYEGSGLLAAMVSGGTLLLIAVLSFGLRQKLGAGAITIVGAFVGILFGAPLFFPIVAPSASTGLLALIYVGSAGIGALIGAISGLIAFRSKKRGG